TADHAHDAKRSLRPCRGIRPRVQRGAAVAAMALSAVAFLALLAIVAASRLVEVAISRRHQRRLASLGATQVSDRRFPLMVALHAAILAGAAVEVVAWHRPLFGPLALAMALV